MDYTFTFLIIAATATVSIVAFGNRELLHKLLFIPSVIEKDKQWYRFLSHGLLHADWFHLGINMFVLWEFGRHLEKDFRLDFGTMGGLRYLAMYIIAIAVSSIWSFIKHRANHSYSALGASGAVSAVLFAFILINPMTQLQLMFLPFIPLNGIIFGGLYLGYSAYMAKRSKDNIGHDAHFWGAVFGFIFPILLRPAYFMEFLEKTGLIR